MVLAPVVLATVVLALIVLTGASGQEAASSARPYAEAAERLLQQGNPTGALAEIAKALAEDEGYAPAWYLRGLAHGQLDQHAEALDAFVRATEINPGWGAAHRFASLSTLR